jgi:putative ABC transport system permease protein
MPLCHRGRPSENLREGFSAFMTFLNDLKFALRSLSRAKGVALTVVLTLALGIGANAAIFSVVRGVLLRPLANRDEDRLIYIRQSAPGLKSENTAFSVPEIQDLRERTKTFSAFGDFSTIGFTMVGLGEPRQIRSGVVSGAYFEVMGLRPVLGRLITAQDDGPNAAGVAVLTYRFWTAGLKSDPTVIGKTIRLGARTATVIGVLEPSVPYPAETELIANVVTSPHHMSATMVTGREHRMTELFGRLAPGATLESARAELGVVHGGIVKEHPETYTPKSDFRISAVKMRDQITSQASTVLWILLVASRSARRSAPATARCGGRCSRRASCCASAARRSASPRRVRWCRCSPGMRRVSRSARSTSRSIRHCCGSASCWPSSRRCCSPSFRGFPRRTPRTGSD